MNPTSTSARPYSSPDDNLEYAETRVPTTDVPQPGSEHFPTGSVRDSREGKGRFDLLPPRALRLLARHFELGAQRYGERNWELGQPLSRLMDSTLRHLFRYMELGEPARPVEDGIPYEDHLTAAACNILAAMEIRERAYAGLLSSKLCDL